MSTNCERKTLEILNWRQLIDYVNYLNGNNDHQIRICIIDEEDEEIRLESEEDFQQNIQYAKEKGLQSLKFLIYANNLFKFDGIFYLNRNENVTLSKFPSEKFLQLSEKILPKKWYIPVKSDEDFGICLRSAIEILRENQLDENIECRKFLDLIVPDAFTKLQTSQSVFTWPQDIHQHIFELLILFIDLLRVRLHQKPIPIVLLETLAIIFDPNTTFSQKHKTDALPNGRTFLMDDENFLRRSADRTKDSFLWIQFLIEQFINSNGLNTFLQQFEQIDQIDSNAATKEYIALLNVFAKCHQLIVAERFRMLFSPSIRRSIDFLLEHKKHQNPPSDELKRLNEVLLEICLNFDMSDEINQLLQIPSVSSSPIITTTNSIKPKKSKHKDVYERLADNLRDINLNPSNQSESQRSVVPKSKRRRTEKRNDLTDDSISTGDKRSMKRKNQRLINTFQSDKSRTTTNSSGSYDRSNGDEILRYFAPMKIQVGLLYDELDNAMCRGDLRQVLKIEEKLKVLRPYSARFIADENTPDGSVMRPGEMFRKSWILLNDGSMPWSKDDIQLIRLTDTIEMTDSARIPITAPHDRTIISVDLKCPERAGIYESKWILSYRNKTFGPIIWCSIEVCRNDSFELIDVPLPDCFDLSKPFRSMNNNRTPPPSPRPPLHFVDAVVTNIFSVAKQAGSTAKAIFNTLQANDDSTTRHNDEFSNDPIDLLETMGFIDREKNQRLLNENHQDLTKVIEILSFENNSTADQFFNAN